MCHIRRSRSSLWWFMDIPFYLIWSIANIFNMNGGISTLSDESFIVLGILYSQLIWSISTEEESWLRQILPLPFAFPSTVYNLRLSLSYSYRKNIPPLPFSRSWSHSTPSTSCGCPVISLRYHLIMYLYFFLSHWAWKSAPSTDLMKNLLYGFAFRIINLCDLLRALHAVHT